MSRAGAGARTPTIPTRRADPTTTRGASSVALRRPVAVKRPKKSPLGECLRRATVAKRVGEKGDVSSVAGDATTPGKWGRGEEDGGVAGLRDAARLWPLAGTSKLSWFPLTSTRWLEGRADPSWRQGSSAGYPKRSGESGKRRSNRLIPDSLGVLGTTTETIKQRLGCEVGGSVSESGGARAEPWKRAHRTATRRRTAGSLSLISAQSMHKTDNQSIDPSSQGGVLAHHRWRFEGPE